MLVANMGHWATGTKFFDQLMSTSKYHDKLLDLIEAIQQHARDLQDLEDEDDSMSGHFLDDGEDYGGEVDDEDGHDYQIEDDEEEEEEEDEAELEMEHEKMRQEEELARSRDEGAGEEVYWEGETEQEVDNRQNDTKQRLRRPTAEELEEQLDALDDIEDTYRVNDRQRAESEGYISRGGQSNTNNRDPMDRPRARYPSNRILRQSKHVKAPAKPKIEVDESEIEEEEEEEEEEDEVEEEVERHVAVRNRYRYGAQKKVILDEDSELVKVSDDGVEESVKTPAPKKVVNNKKKTTLNPKSRPASTGTSAGKETAISKPSATFRDPYAYSTRKAVPITTSKPTSSYNKKKSTTGTKKRRTRNNKSRKLYRRAFLDDDYPFLTSPSSHSSKTPLTLSPSPSSSASSFSDSLVNMAWVGMVAYPETQNADSFVSHDWRTIYRLRYWNLIAEDVMLLNNIRFMDFFSMVCRFVYSLHLFFVFVFRGFYLTIVTDNYYSLCVVIHLSL
jgi:hypothetical protein